MADSPIYTIGYGNRTFEAFVQLLGQYTIAYVVDVRTHPFSRFQPDFAKLALADGLAREGLRYIFMGDVIGGMPDDRSCYRDGKVIYEQYSRLPSYQAGIDRLLRAHARGVQMAVMCSELRPKDCHRSKLIGQSLAELGARVLHINEYGALTSQEEVIRTLTGGQLNLFGDPEQFTSRKKYDHAD